MNFGNLINAVSGVYLKHAKIINTVSIGIGVIGTGLLSGKASIKAHEILEKKREEKKNIKNDSRKEKHIEEDLSTKEKIKNTWKIWIPTMVCGLSTISLVILNTYQMNKTIKTLTSNVIGLASLCADKDEVLKKYKKATKEVLKDDEKIEEIDKIVKEKSNKELLNNLDLNDDIKCRDGDFICIDSFSGRLFSTNKDRLDKASAILQKIMMLNDYCTLNDFYELIGLDDIEIGDLFSWTLDDLYWSNGERWYGDFHIEVDSIMHNGKPVGVIRYPLPTNDVERYSR